MLAQNVLELQPTNGGPILPGCWTLAPGRAISLRPREAGVLRIEMGRVWATFDGPHQGHGNESGDHFLLAGQHLAVRAGQRLVLEPWCEVGDAPVCVQWTSVLKTVPVRTARWKMTLARSQNPICGHLA